MSVVLYKKIGDVIERQKCDPFSFLHLLDSGWVLDPKDIEPAKIKIPDDKLDEDERLAELRGIAKERGIKQYWLKGVDKLEQELKDNAE
jgi:hypothetical protein